MRLRKRWIVIGGLVAAGVLGAGGISLAAASDDDAPLTGETRKKAEAAALKHVGEGTVTETELGDDGATYGVEILKQDGSQVEVNLDDSGLVCVARSGRLTDGPSRRHRPVAVSERESVELAPLVAIAGVSISTGGWAMRKRGLLTALLLLAVTAGACGDDKESDTKAAAPPPAAPAAPAVPGAINPADFSAQVDNPLFPVSSFGTLELSGPERDSKTGKTIEVREVTRRLDKTDTIAGVGVAVLEVKEYEDGQLVELTEDYFAQHRDGSVWYFGERVSDYKDGKVVGHGGQWLAGEGGNLPGLYMPANPAVGQEFAPEQVAGVAEERFKVVDVNLEVAVPAGRYTGCIKVEEFDVPDKVTEFKFHCPRVGTVRAEGPDGTAELVRFS